MLIVAPRFFGGGEHLHRVRVAGGDRFLAQHVRARLQGGNGEIAVRNVWGGYRDDIRFQVGQHLLAVAVRTGNLVALGRAVGTFFGAVVHPHDLHLSLLLKTLPGRNVAGVGDHASADDGYFVDLIAHLYIAPSEPRRRLHGLARRRKLDEERNLPETSILEKRWHGKPSQKDKPDP